MTVDSSTQPTNSSSRRDFIKVSGAVAMSSALAGAPEIARSAYPSGFDTIRIGLVGCGGRGMGAAENALGADPNVVLAAMGDVFEEPITRNLAILNSKAEMQNKVDVIP